MGGGDTASPARDRQFQRLSRQTCFALLRTVAIGRVAWATPTGEVVVVPVNFAVDGEAVVFQTAAGGKLDAVREGRPLSFEADDMEPALQVGWSVLLTGMAEEVTAPDQVRRLRELPFAPWANLPDPVFVRLPAREVTGRRIRLHPGGVTVERVGGE
ncbi:Uncharacterized protein LI90_3557 [Carbonactinospora thermoautotrophica]|uniref:Uncharacterized protein n=1 Tax=Carbonactinospora thermoautotrophica TaxID=1469144 RepID=A0A132MXH4_9ACTN|nr:pyridoxamine 5'-phosphate oxidase family protein [Carbonactinospora thermoautotrophica]KWX02514.1 Uncharacterized protein LI90_3557 [Carbonactinospora thermoautotrophica]